MLVWEGFFMKEFMDKDFLLETETAKTLYHEHAAPMPIYDYHCHVNPREIADTILIKERRLYKQNVLGFE